MIERTYRISDVVNEEFLRFPLVLLSNPRYKEMSLEAKFVYALLLNRLTLSQKNGWINEDNEVYLIYTREEEANILNISYKKAISAFRELIEKNLLYEQRQGRGYPNLLYVIKAELADMEAIEILEEEEQREENFSKEAAADCCGTDQFQDNMARPDETELQELQKAQVLNCRNSGSKNAVLAHQELPKGQPSKIKNIQTEKRKNDHSLSSVNPLESRTDKQTDGDDHRLNEILNHCELALFQENIQRMFRAAIERLYYSDTVKIGNSRLPGKKIRSYLELLDADALISVLDKMKQNQAKIINPTGYMMSMIFNELCEKDSGLILSLPPEYQPTSNFYLSSEDNWKGDG